MVNVLDSQQTKNLVVVHRFQEHRSEFYVEGNYELMCQGDKSISANGDYS
jgi:hypothetical protein